MSAYAPGYSGGATRDGVVAGVIVGLLSLPLIAVSAVGGIGAPVGMLRLLFLFAASVAFGIAGFSASRRSGRLRSGLWAGLLAAMLAMFIAFCVGVVIVLLLAPHALAVGAPSRVATRVARAALRFAIGRLSIAGLVVIVCGLVAGLIGAAFGRSAHPHPPYQSPAPDFNAQPTQVSIASTPPAASQHDYAAVYTPDPFVPMTPRYDDYTPTVAHDMP